MEKNEVIDWWQLVWFPHAISKLSFILWLVMRNRMITGERLVKRGYKGDVIYIYICRNGLESRYHLFFECSFSYCIWKFCIYRCKEDNPPVFWKDILQLGRSKWTNKSLKGLKCCLVLSTIYNIWLTINDIKHAGQPRIEEQILNIILREICSRIVGKGKFPKTRENLVFFHLWNFPADLLV
jgi:hypothetical protein